MSRLSRVALKARESVFAGGPELYVGDTNASCPPSLEECVMLMEDCCEEVFEAQHLLRNGTRDLPRMTKILSNEPVFMLVPESTVQKHKRDLVDDLEPVVSELISRAEQGLADLQKREAILQSKLDNPHSRTKVPTATTAMHKSDARRLNMMVNQRKMLEMQVRTLEEEILELERAS